MNEEVSFTQLDMKAPRAGKTIARFPLRLQNADKLKFKYLKYRNLQELLLFVPPIHHEFYNNLPHFDGPGNSKRIRRNDEDDGTEADRFYRTDSE
ncbi:hypothetical protein PR048_028743 [Dryococelus australis]|uniref:Uncharacterized protein n=1 Tax=Dryococelus australis TaxID=614101 RepID=A0ABQ9GBD8_9NEOP|nr:hypothetical protein PR048_028743 [Dryococelus australis]